MSANTQDATFHARVSQGHVDNFHRKIAAAVNEGDLRNILQTLDVAVERKMINADDRAVLLDAVSTRRRNLIG